MVEDPSDEMKVIHLDLPARREDLARLELGSAVYLNGLVYTAREGVYKKVLDEGVPLPMDLRGPLLSAGAQPPRARPRSPFPDAPPAA